MRLVSNFLVSFLSLDYPSHLQIGIETRDWCNLDLKSKPQVQNVTCPNMIKTKTREATRKLHTICQLTPINRVGSDPRVL